MPSYNDVDDERPRHRPRRESYSPPQNSARHRSRSQENRRQSHGDHHKSSRDQTDSRRYRSRNRDRSHRKRSYSPNESSGRHRDEKRNRRSPNGDRDNDRRRSRKHRDPSTSRSPPRHRDAQQLATTKPKPLERSKAPLPDQQAAFDTESGVKTGTPPPEKQKPNFAPTGRLAAEANTVKSAHGQAIVLKYHEPAEARKPPPKEAWRMYVFKGADIVDTVELAEQSCWLFGREAAVADFAIEHPSCSKQHAVVQFRYIEKRNEFGDRKGRVRPYVIDLESANGTSVNGEKLPGGRYVELRDKDVITFGHSTREYVMQLPPAG